MHPLIRTKINEIMCEQFNYVIVSNEAICILGANKMRNTEESVIIRGCGGTIFTPNKMFAQIVLLLNKCMSCATIRAQKAAFTFLFLGSLKHKKHQLQESPYNYLSTVSHILIKLCNILKINSFCGHKNNHFTMFLDK